MQISKKQWSEVEALLDKVVEQRDQMMKERDAAKQEVEILKMSIEDSTRKNGKLKEKLSEANFIAANSEKRIKKLVIENTTLSTTLSESVVIMNKLSKKLGIVGSPIATSYDSSTVEALLHKFDVKV